MSRVLLDTHLLLWLSDEEHKVPKACREVIERPETEPVFSTTSIWEIAIKHSRRRPDFQADPGEMREKMLGAGYTELPVLGEHAVAVAQLPWVHKDPFDRMLVAQAIVEGIELLTVDTQLARYPGPIRLF